MSKDRPFASRLKDLPQEDRPQERLERLGAPALADRELLAMIIRSGHCEKRCSCSCRRDAC
jgi:DNA repair protein RadC